MVDLPLERHMLPNPDRHLLGRGDISDWWLARVCIGDPKRNGESICCPSKAHRQRPYKVEEKGREPRFVGYSMCEKEEKTWGRPSLTVDICPRGQRRVLRQRVGNIVVGPIWVMIGLLGIVVILGRISIKVFFNKMVLSTLLRTL